MFEAWTLGARAGRGSRRGWRPNLCSSYKPLKGTNLTVVGGVHQRIMYILQIVYPMRRREGEEFERGEGGKGGRLSVLFYVA